MQVLMPASALPTESSPQHCDNSFLETYEQLVFHLDGTEKMLGDEQIISLYVCVSGHFQGERECGTTGVGERTGRNNRQKESQ